MTTERCIGEVECPKCKRSLGIRVRGFKIKPEMVAEDSQQTENPKPYYLSSSQQARMLKPMVEAGMQDELAESATFAQFIKAWNNTELKQENFPSYEAYVLAVAGETFSKSQVFTCPYCQAELQVLLQINLADSAAIPAFHAPDEAKPEHGVDNSAQVAEFLKICNDTGLLQAFEEAAKEQWRLQQLRGVTMPEWPKDILRFFVVFLKTAKRSFLKPSVTSSLADKYPGQSVQYFQSNGIGAVTLDGQIFRFVPACLFGPRRPKRLTDELSQPGQLSAEDAAREWVKTRFGYVAMGHQLFLNELSRKSPGAFAKPPL